MTDTTPDWSPTANDTRRTADCPNCRGTVREPRSGDEWICDDCARYWDESDLDI